MPFRKRVSLGFFCAVGCLLPMAYIAAKPAGFQLRSGEALPPVQTESGAFVIESGKYAAIDWEKFSIDAGEHLEFQQFDSQSYVVNRVLGPKASELLGKLSSNGAVYLINPNGVFIGSQALIETAGFIASTLDLLEARDQELHFAGMSEERIVNEGAIRCEGGDVFLIGRTVENSGTIEALREGLISGCDVMISSTRAPCVHIRARGDIDPTLLEKNPYAIAIRHSGMCKAREVYLVAEEGTSEVSGQVFVNQEDALDGGVIHVLGDHVHLLDGAHIDASGESSGGTILIGGDYQGNNESVKNAQHTWIDKDAVVRADALEEGNGGKIIFWGDQSMVYHGSASACGGTQGGDGGLIEVSGKKLQFEGKASTGAPSGRTGTLLLDPTNIVISTGGDSGGSFGGCMGGTNTYMPSSDPSNTINTTTLADLLNAPCNVTISTVGSDGGGTGSITVSNPLTWSEATTLTLTAASFITVAASITNTSASTGFTALSLTSNGNGATTNPGILLSAGTISTTGGDVILEGTSSATPTSSHGVYFNGGRITTGSGNISVTGFVPVGVTGASIYGLYMNTANGMTSSTGNISVSGITNSTGNGCYGMRISQTWTTGTTGTLTFHDCVGGTGTNPTGLVFSTAVSTGGNIVATTNIQSGLGTGTPNGQGFYTSGPISSTGGGNIQITASCTLATAGTGYGIGIRLVTGGSLTTTGSGNITLIGTGSAVAGATSSGVSIVSGSGGVTTVNGTINVGGHMPGGSQSGVGVLLAATNSLSSTTGIINVSGTSSATGNGSHGVSVTGGWTTGTSGAVTFGSSISDGMVTVAGCQGGTGQGSHGVNLGAAFVSSGDVTFLSCVGGTNSTTGGNGINIGAAFSTAGNISAVATIQGRGNGGDGFASGFNFATTGSDKTISITASGTGTAGACHGITLTGGTMNSPSGTITLIGTSGASSTASFGVNLASAANSITSTSGTISVTGTSLGTVAGSNGISINTNPWAAGTTATLTLTGTAGSTGVSYGIDKGQALTSNGPIVFNGNAGGGSGSYGNRWSGNITTSGDSVTTLGSTFLASAVILNTTSSAPAGADIVFSGSTATIDGGEDLTLNAGTGGAVTFGGAIGQIVPLGDLTITSAKTTLNAVNIGGNITASSFTITTASPATLTGSSIIDVSAASGGSLSFPSTIDGTSAGAQNLTLTANATGTVTLVGSVGTNVRLGDMAISGGTSELTIGSAVTNILANSFTVGGTVPTTLQNSALLTIDTSGGTGSIAFGGTITGTLAGAQNLTLAANMAGTVTLSNNVGTTVRLGTLTITGGTGGLILGSAITSIQASSFTVGGIVPTTLQNGAALTIDTLGGGAIAFGGTITGTSAGAQALTLTANGSGPVTLSSDVGATRLGAFAIGAGTGSLSIGTSVTGIQANSFTVPASAATTLNNSGTLTINTSDNNGTITLAGPVDGAVSHTQALTLNPGIGNIALTGAIGSSVPLGAITILNATNVTANGITATSLTQNGGLGTTTFNGLLSMTSDITLTGTNFTFNAPVLTASNVSIANLGLLAIAAAGDMTLNGSFTQSTGLVQTAGNITTAGQNIAFGGGITLTGNVVLNTGGILGTITFNGTVDGGQDLQLNAGNIVFAQAVGGTPLNSLQATAAGSIDIYGNQTVSTGPMLYTGAVVLHGTSITLTDSGSSGIGFALPLGTSTGNVISGNTNLTLFALSSSISVSGDIDLSGSDGASGSSGKNLTATAATNITLNGQVLTTGGAGTAGAGGIGGDVSLFSSMGSVSVHNINVSGGNGTITGGNGGDITLQAASGYSGGYPDGLIILNNDRSSGADGNLVSQPGIGALSGSILLSSNRASPSTVATIVSSSSGNDVTIIGANITIGPNEAMTVLGNLELMGNTITLGDTVALETLSIISNTVNLLTHGPYQILDNQGVLYTTPTLHFLGGSGYLQIGTLVPSTGPLNAQNLGLAPSTFRPLLFYSGHILNYDTSAPPPPPPPSPTPSPLITTTPESRAFARYQLGIADAQLSDLLPIYSFPFAPLHYVEIESFRVGKDSSFLKILP